MEDGDERQKGVQVDVEAVGPLDVQVAGLVLDQQFVGDKPIGSCYEEADSDAIDENHPEDELE